MKFYLAAFVWLLISAILGLGIWLSVAKGNYWVLIVAIVGMVGLVGKVGCKTH